MSLSPEPEAGKVFSVIRMIYIGVGSVLIIAAILAVVGGIFALLRRYWGWALAGAIISVLAFFPMGIPAVVFVAQSRREFGQAPAPLDAGAVTEKTLRPMTGGILLIISAAFGLLGTGLMAAYSFFMTDLFYPMADMPVEMSLGFERFSQFIQMLYTILI